MKKFLTTPIGRLRLIALLEGISLLLLVFVAVPLRYGFDIPTLSRTLGPIHGALFVLYAFGTLRTGMEEEWKFFQTTWKVLLASLIPFGTFYVDQKILKPLQE